MENKLPSDEELHAFIDGELDDVRAQSVAEMIAVSPHLFELVEQYRADKDLIARVYGPLINLPMPAPLTLGCSVIEGSVARPYWRRSRVFQVATAIAATLLIVIAGYPLIWETGSDPLVAEAVAVRAGEVQPETQVLADGDMTAAALDQFADAALAVPIKVPNLEKAGYVLTGVAAFPDRGGRHALQLSYRSRDGKLFTMFMRPPGGTDRFELTRHADLQVCIWQDDDLGVVMLGQMPAHEMLRVATSTYADLNF